MAEHRLSSTVLLRSKQESSAQHPAKSDPPLTLRDGLEIRALVRADFYPATGRFQVIVNDIDPSFTLGKLALTKEQILRELAEKGLAERNRMLGVPVPAVRIGVLTSPDADGWNDFLRHLEESEVGFDVTLVQVAAVLPWTIPMHKALNSIWGHTVYPEALRLFPVRPSNCR